MSSISQLLTPQTKDLGKFQASHSLLQSDRTKVGLSIFFDRLVSAVFPPGQGLVYHG